MKIGNNPLDAIYAESIKPIRNQMRRYDYLSLLNSILMYLNAPLPGDRQKDLQRLPWVVERLAIWLFADKPAEYGTKIPAEHDLRRLVDMAWRAADKVYEADREIKQLGLYVRQAWLPQIPYQMSLDSHAFSFQIYLLKRLPANSKLIRFLNEKAGMQILDYFKIALVYWTHSLTDKPWFNYGFMQAIAYAFPVEEQRQFLDSITFHLQNFKDQCSDRTIKLDEWFQPTYFYQTPCILHRGAAVPMGRPTFRRYFEGLLSDWIAASGRSDLRQDFDRLIESYVAETLSRAGLTFMRENETKKLPGMTRVADFLVVEPTGLVLFEVKNKALSEAVPASREPHELASRLKATVVKGVGQLADTEAALKRLPAYKGKKFFRILVTATNLWILSLLISNHLTIRPRWRPCPN